MLWWTVRHRMKSLLLPRHCQVLPLPYPFLLNNSLVVEMLPSQRPKAWQNLGSEGRWGGGPAVTAVSLRSLCRSPRRMFFLCCLPSREPQSYHLVEIHWTDTQGDQFLNDHYGLPEMALLTQLGHLSAPSFSLVPVNWSFWLLLCHTIFKVVTILDMTVAIFLESYLFFFFGSIYHFFP